MNLLLFYLVLALWVAFTLYCIWKAEREKRKFGGWTKVYVKKVLKPLLEKSVSQRNVTGFTRSMDDNPTGFKEKFIPIQCKLCKNYEPEEKVCGIEPKLPLTQDACESLEIFSHYLVDYLKEMEKEEK